MTFKSLIWKIFFPLTFTGLLLITLSIGMAYSLIEPIVIQQIQERLKDQAQLAGQVYFSEIRDNDFTKVKGKISQILLSSQVRYTLISDEGAVVADSYLAPESIENQSAQSDFYAITKQGEKSFSRDHSLDSEFLTVAVPVQIKGKNFVLRLGEPTAPLIGRLNDLIANLIAFGLVLCVAWVLISYWIARRVYSPVARIAFESRGLRRGHFNRRVSSEEYLSKETAQIIKSLNRMASRLERQEKEIDLKSQEMNAMLESMAEGLLAFDSDFDFLFINQSAYTLLGIDKTLQPKNLFE
ncbi:MAG: hypothetical protein KDD25_09445, partial [Bdellovibrionales bacterium]|nr:hypothetical protein [Bdellovibrionales bacterium]